MTGRITTTLSQEALWLDAEGADEPARHNLLWCISLAGAVDLSALEDAITRILRRHDALRTVFTISDTGLTGHVREAAPVVLAVNDQTGLDAAARAQQIEAFGLTPYHLANGPMYRFALFSRDGAPSELACGFHHLVMDGGAWVRLFTELAAELAGQPMATPGLGYADHARAERDRFADRAASEAALAYWREATEGHTASWPLPYRSLAALDGKARKRGGASGRVLVLDLDAQSHDRLVELAASGTVSAYRIVLAGFAAWFAGLAERSRLPVGTVFSGRDESTRDVIGYFVQLGLVVADLAPAMSLTDLARQMQERVRAARQHETCPAALALRSLRRDHDEARMPFTPVSLVRVPDAATLTAGGLRLSQRRVFLPVADRDVSAYFEHDAASTRLTFVVRSDTLDPAALQRLVAGFTQFLSAALARPDAPFDSLPRMAREEAAAVERLSSGPDEPRPPGQRLHRLILAQVARTPDRIALVEGDRSWRYQELVARAARLAGRLVATGHPPGRAIGLLLPVSAELVIAELACMMAGLVFTPLDPDWPTARIEAVLDQLDAPIALTRQSEAAHTDLDTVEWLLVDSKEDIVDTAPVPFRPGRLAALPEPAPLYCFFTSGSTGRPKGAVNTHAGILNRLWSMSEMLGVPSDDVVLASAGPATDTSIWLFYWPLLHGGRTVLASRETMAMPGQVTDLCRREGVSATDLVPALLRDWAAHLAKLPRSESPLPRLRLLSVGGETMRAADVRIVQTLLPHVRVYNTFGPTEASIGTLFHRVEAKPTDPVPIGRPLPNVRAVIVDRAGRALPMGVPGELCLAGLSLASGYLGDADATRRAFVDLAPFGGHPRRFYRTGDRAWMGADGLFHHLGRIDHQFQINGHRVESGEVEAALNRLDEIAQAAVIPERAETGGPVVGLVAFVEPADPRAVPELAALRQRLVDALPRHMLPTRLVVVDTLPLTGTGKPDRIRLEAGPWRSAEPRERPLRQPETALERDIADVWADTLGLEAIGTEADFFVDLGGDSLSGLQAMLALESRLGVSLGLRLLYDAPTVRQQAALIGDDPGRPARDRLTALADRLERSLSGWPGWRAHPGGLLRTLGPDAPASRLFWCCQNGREFEVLADALAPSVTVSAMRSGHLVMANEGALVEALAERYADEIASIQPSGPILLGGNCQGATIVLAVAAQLAAHGRTVAHIVMLDPPDFGPMAWPVTLVHGELSQSRPDRNDPAVRARLSALCPAGHTLTFIPGAHGEFFRPGPVDALARIIRAVI